MDVELLKVDFMEPAIRKLNTDSLILIFNKLPAADLVRTERVCRAWRKIAKQSWSTFKKLSLDPRELGLRTIGTGHVYPYINNDVIEKILKRCGKYLLEFDQKEYCYDCLLLVANHCKNIQSINCYQISLEGIEELSQNCSNIK